MRNTWLIIKREYLERVRTRSFIVLTLLLPAIVGGAFILPMKIATMKSGGKTPHLVVVTSSLPIGRTGPFAVSGERRRARDDDQAKTTRQRARPKHAGA